MARTDDLVRLTARQAVALLEKREVSPLELIDAALARIEAVDGVVNALPVRCPERARDHARRLIAAAGLGDCRSPSRIRWMWRGCAAPTARPFSPIMCRTGRTSRWRRWSGAAASCWRAPTRRNSPPAPIPS